MVSERRSGTYAAGVSGVGESDREAQASSHPPAHNTPITAPQRSLFTQRNQTPKNLENPLLINVNENPNAILVSPALTGSPNYGTWSISMRIAPANSQPEFPAWRRCNLIVCSWIFKAVHPSIAQSIIHMDKAKDVWEDLRRRFSQRDPHRISTLQSQIYTLRQGNMSVNEYYTKCKTLWEEMSDLRPLPICKCDPRCHCNVIDTIREEREVDLVIRFLQGLSDDYTSLRSGVLVMDPLPEVYKVFVMAEKLERQLNLEKLSLGSLEISHANSVQGSQQTEEIVAAINGYNGRRNTGNYNSKGTTKCIFCGMTRHIIEKCYKKHGYPPGWIPGYKSENKQNAFAASVDTNSSSTVNNIADLGFTAEQMQKFMALFQSQCTQGVSPNTTATVSLVPNFTKGESANVGKYVTSHVNSISLCTSTWILDTGATDHIVCCLDFFIDYQVVTGAEVNLPTGTRVAVKHTGNIKIGNNLWLKDVMHIPSFRFNIISCVIQEITGRTIGIAKQHRGLYLLMDPHEQSVNLPKHFAMSSVSTDIWHQRLGYFPVNKMHLLKGVSLHSNKTLACDVCHLAKHKRSVFPLSTSTTNACFDLIHADIWGPFVVSSMKGEFYFLTLVDDHSRFTWIHLMQHKSEARP
ncbi:PREDICTED: uncharacterized protein LOC109186961 [Ipomoea nil]|uniref:uncharacterized protein LOC109186961 n=1 Tax=Ipomoea nil TaxID=35883 RepID=UPI000901759A|nr:PREDICTED: uncharacterized protein LOC109186961 [Ipomoea nil]